MDSDCRASAWSTVVPEETFLDEGAARFFPEIYASSVLAFIQFQEAESLATLSISHTFSKIHGNRLISTERLCLLFLGCFSSEYM